MGLAVVINVVVGSEMVESERVGIADGAFVVVEQEPSRVHGSRVSSKLFPSFFLISLMIIIYRQYTSPLPS